MAGGAGRTAATRAPAWVVGSVVHDALAAWRFPDIGGYRVAGGDEAGSGDFGRWAESRARSYGLTDANQIADAVRSAGRLLDRFRGSELYAQMDGAERRLHEVPYSLETERRGREPHCRRALSRDGEWTLVEFKTDAIRDEDELKAVLAGSDYRAQAERYREAVGRLLGERPRTVLCLLNFDGGVQVREVGT